MTPPPTHTAARPWIDTLVVRQPIFGPDLEVVAHELLHAARHATTHPAVDSREAAATLVDGLIGMGTARLTDGLPAAIPVPRTLLISHQLDGLGSLPLWVMLGPDVDDAPDVRAAIGALRADGHQVVLVDMSPTDPRWPLLDQVDVVGLDAGASTAADRTAIARRLDDTGVVLLAREVERPDLADTVRDEGATYIHGSFFTRPQVVAGRRARVVSATRWELLAAVHEQVLDFDRVEELVRRDLRVADGFLRHINAAGVGLRNRVDSIGHALVLLGEERTRRWVSLVVLATDADEKPSHLAATASTRARLCELLGPRVGLADRGLELFMVGMFSLLDAVLDVPLDEAIEGLPLSVDARSALLGEDTPLRDVLRLATAIQDGAWDVVDELAGDLELPEAVVGALYLEAVTGGVDGTLGPA